MVRIISFLILRIIFNRYGNLQIIKNRFLLKNLIKITCGMREETLLVIIE